MINEIISQTFIKYYFFLNFFMAMYITLKLYQLMGQICLLLIFSIALKFSHMKFSLLLIFYSKSNRRKLIKSHHFISLNFLSTHFMLIQRDANSVFGFTLETFKITFNLMICLDSSARHVLDLLKQNEF